MDHAVSLRSATARQAWLTGPTAFLCLVGVLVPNALSIGALLAGIGMPPRSAMIAIYATLAIAARVLSPPLTVVLYVVAAIYDVIATLALLFNLAPSELGRTLHLLVELDLFMSPFYLALIGTTIAVVAANILLLTRKRALLRQGNPLVLVGFAAAFGITDFVANTSPHYHYGSLYGAGKPVESAADASGFRRAALSGDGKVLLVMVEALGAFADPAKQALLTRAFDRAEATRRYRLTTGTTTYYGSTTAAEMRELCDSREPYDALLAGKQLTCLPALMAARDYRTVALHNFTSQFFGRWQWYPKLGFEKTIFGEDLAETFKSRALCGGPFRGPCDTDMVPLIKDELRTAGRPTFFYWLTLSTHVPIKPREGTPRLSCDRAGGPIGDVEVCYMTEMWIDLFEKLADMATELAPMEILVVGDHAPPLWSRAGRNVFEPGKVPWFRLTPTTAVAQESRG
ncbi:MAG TPA: sulfatase-like hydrolase/transferase [Xanthobacteraceae bacterium]|nr:sulfatase-like hydrolase/transferase [Xanthobacteraceae bacterium]